MVGRLLTALALLTATAAADAPTTHQQWTRAALARLPIAVADRTDERRPVRETQLDIVAREIARVSAKAPLAPRVWSSLLGSVAFGESALDSAILRGQCARHQCDPKLSKDGTIRFQSVGGWQQKLFAHNADLWHRAAAGDIPAQVEMADRQLRRSLTRCKAFAPMPQHVYRAYGGGSCSFATGREAEKVAAFGRMMATPAPKAGGAS